MKDTQKELSIDTIKYIAITAMLIDHIATAFVSENTTLYNVMDLIGRITGPIMFFAAVEGYHHTRNLKKYMMRLFIFALISYLPFMYAFKDTFNPLRLNIIFNILFGLMAIYCRRNIKNMFLKVLIIFALLIISLTADYGTGAIITMLAFDIFYGNLKNQIYAYLVVILLDYGLLNYFIYPFESFFYMGEFNSGNTIEDFSQLGFFIPAVLLYFYNGKLSKQNKYSKWIFYIFYPLHLAIIGLIRFLLNYSHM